MDQLSIIFLFEIMTVRDEKMFLVVSRDLLTDHEFKGKVSVSRTTQNDKSERTMVFHLNSRNGSTLINFDHLSIS